LDTTDPWNLIWITPALGSEMRRVFFVLTVLFVAAIVVGTNLLTDNTRASGTVTLLTHDSFVLSEQTILDFESETGLKLKIISAGDAGTVLSSAVLSAGRPTADVIFGIDNTMISKALDGNIFEAYVSPELEFLGDSFQNSFGGLVSPIDYGDVCVNYEIEKYGLNPPKNLSDLVKPAFSNQLVVSDPAASSPGLAFLLATVATYGTDWPDYWAQLRANGVKVVGSWSDAYYVEFSKGGGDGEYPMVLSYATSPAAEIVYAEEPKPEFASTAAMADGCFRQVEYAGVLRGAENPAGAKLVIDWLLSAEVQADIPLNMFVYPTREGIELPLEFSKFAPPVLEPLSLDHNQIANNLDAWLAEWDAVMKN
jgi:thiamine transport system substrate-binding protein